LGLFANRGEWGNAAIALALGTTKVAVDCISAAPGMERLFFARMGEGVSAVTRRELARSLAQYRAACP
jgi:hypothetical protein